MISQIITIERAKGALLGLAVGDALGATLEFKERDSYPLLTDMIGGGPFRLQAGQWTDDTSMMLCLSDSLIEKGGMNLADQAERYVRWFRSGENSCTEHCFDIGMTVKSALCRYETSKNPQSGSTAEYTAGNGSLMRIAPIALFYAQESEKTAMEAANLSSLVTHGEERCVQACEIMTLLIHRVLNEKDVEDKQKLITMALSDYLLLNSNCHPEIAAIARCEFFTKSRDEVNGTGYVVASLEAALWCFINSDNYEQAVLLAANLGDDADTTAAIVGQLAGAFYTESAIPSKWLEKLVWREHISDIAIRLLTVTSEKTNEEVKANSYH